jgi:hypothetical protein
MSRDLTPSQPLPRSLAPLPDEILPGYLMRLAHRAGTTVDEIAHRTGLRGPRARNPMPLGYLHTLDETRLQALAETTRLTPTEARSLLLGPLAARYGPLDPHYTRRATPVRVINNNPWVWTTTWRYCPQCLAGDPDDAIQRLHGGTWRRHWRLPVVFSCLTHRRLLRHLCPGCHALVATAGMIDRADEDDLHPTQCRGRGCGTQLAAPQGHVERVLDASTWRVLDRLQRRVARVLSLSAPPTVRSTGWPIPAAQYFMDLRTVTALTLLSWPAARALCATPLLTQVLDAEAAWRQHEYERLLRGAKKHSSQAFLRPAADALAGAAVLHVADRLLRLDEARARDALAPLAEAAASRATALTTYLRHLPGSSLPLQMALTSRTPRGAGRQWLADALHEHDRRRTHDAA